MSVCLCVGNYSALFQNATLDYRRKKYGLCDKNKFSRYYSSLELWKEYGINFLKKKMKRQLNFTYDSWISIEEIVTHILYILLSTWHKEERFIWQFLEARLQLNFSVKNWYMREKKKGKMTSFKQLKDNIFLFIFHIINAYFVRERFHLYIFPRKIHFKLNWKA